MVNSSLIPIKVREMSEVWCMCKPLHDPLNLQPANYTLHTTPFRLWACCDWQRASCGILKIACFVCLNAKMLHSVQKNTEIRNSCLIRVEVQPNFIQCKFICLLHFISEIWTSHPLISQLMHLMWGCQNVLKKLYDWSISSWLFLLFLRIRQIAHQSSQQKKHEVDESFHRKPATFEHPLMLYRIVQSKP